MLGSQDSREIKQLRRKLNCVFKSEILNYEEVLFWLVEIQCVVLSFVLAGGNTVCCIEFLFGWWKYSVLF